MPKQYFHSQALNSFIITILLMATLFVALPASLAKTTTVEQSTKSCLWSIQSPSNTVYLLGSLHVLNQEAYPLHPAIERGFEWTTGSY